MDRETIAWGLVFSVPVGVGIVGFSAHVVDRGVLDPVSVAAGVGTTLIIFAIFVFAASVGSPDEERRGDEAE